MNARDILHDHAVERYLRRAIESRALDDDMTRAVKRMTHDAWVTSCLLCRGVEARILDILGVWLCESNGSAWTTVLVEVQGHEAELRKEQVAVKLTLVEAAWRAGLQLDYPQIRKMKAAAEATIADNLVRLAERKP